MALPSVDIDHRALCRHSAALFLRHGHRQLALFLERGGHGGDVESEQGFREGLARPMFAAPLDPSTLALLIIDVQERLAAAITPDAAAAVERNLITLAAAAERFGLPVVVKPSSADMRPPEDRKSTRLNSSH